MNYDEQVNNIYPVLNQYRNLRMICASCGKEHLVQVPVNFNNLNCESCHSFLDPSFWSDGRVVDHSLMRKLISTCYKHSGFAKKVIEIYSRDYHHAKIEEFGIDKSLLLIHAANALVQDGHHSKTIYFLSLFTFIPLVGAFIPLYFTSIELYKNLEYREKFFNVDSYDPTKIPSDNYGEIEKIIRFTDYNQPDNLFFFSQYNPFQQFGSNDGTWSFLVDRRKLTGGEIAPIPANLDIDATYSKIIERVSKMKGVGISLFRFHVDDVLLVDGRLANPKDERLFRSVQYGYYPKENVRNEDIAALQAVNGDVNRAFKRITFYNPQRQLCVRSFVRIQHQGSFTYIESIGTQLLPLAEKPYGFQEKVTLDELEKKYNGLWHSLPDVEKARMTFITWSMICIYAIVCLAWFAEGSLVNSLSLIGSFILTLIIMFEKSGYTPRKEDIYTSQSHGIPFPFNIVAIFGVDTADKEKARLKELQKIKNKQETNSFDFAYQNWSLRNGQSRSDSRNFFEAVDLRLLRRTQDLAIQEAFLECLEDSGIDTSDFREGTAQINNYGIINSGEISGDAKTENSSSKDAKKNKKSKKDKTTSENKNEG